MGRGKGRVPEVEVRSPTSKEPGGFAEERSPSPAGIALAACPEQSELEAGTAGWRGGGVVGRSLDTPALPGLTVATPGTRAESQFRQIPTGILGFSRPESGVSNE